MKKIILLIIVVLMLTAVAIAVLRVSTQPTPVGMGTIQISQPGIGAKIGAGIKAYFTNGKSEIQRSLEAKRSARSFRMKTSLLLHPGNPLDTVIEVSCPDRERFTTTIGERAYRALRIGGRAYVEQQDGSWRTQETQPSGWSPCGDNPGEPAPWAMMNEGRDPATVLAKMLEKTEITRGALVGTPDGNCQQWLVNVNLPGIAAHGHGPGGLNYTVCIDPVRHLPVAVIMGSGSMVTTYTGWNEPIQIEPPQM